MRRIRPATPLDAAALSELAERTFRDAFAADNTAADMDLHCSRSFAPAIQAAEIADPATDTLVVEDTGSLVGYAQLHRGEIPGSVPYADAVELRRIYVDRRWHGSGVARELMDAVVERARESGAAAVWLGVWEHNPRAIRFYRRCGFTEVGTQVFLLGSDPQRDHVMVVSIGAYGRPSDA